MRRPTPSMVVSVFALVFAMAGTGVAAINYAKNAGAVDGRSAVSASASNAKAAGKLVAAGKSGRIPIKFLDLSGIMRGERNTFAQGIEVADNATSTALTVASQAGIGTVTATCDDQAAQAGNEDPQTTITFSNASGAPMNFTRVIGTGNPVVTIVAANTQAAFTINNSNTFRVYAQTGTTHYVVDGNVRQDGRGTPTAACAVWGFALTL